MLFRSLALAVLAAGALPAHAAVSVGTPNFTYVQTFDTLTQRPLSEAVTAWANDTTLAGWSLFNSAGATPGYAADNGNGNTGLFYSYGSAAATDRALGSLASGSTYFGSPASGAVAGYIAVSFRNDTSATLTGFTLGYQGEQWRNGGNTATQKLAVQYGFGSSFAGVSSWANAGGAFDFNSPITGAASLIVDGNSTGKVTGLGGSVSTTWNANDTLWVRWADTNDTGNDHALAIDNLNFTVMSVPEPGGYGIALAGFAALGFFGKRRREARPLAGH